MKDKPPGRNPLAEFTKPECDYFRRECNFTQDEMKVFNLRVRDWSVVQISMELSMSESTVKRIISRIKNKIFKVL